MAELVIAGATRVSIGEGSLSGSVIADHPGDRIAFVTQPGVPAQIAARIAGELADGADSVVVEVLDGEAAKTLAEVDRVCRRLEAAGIGRGDLIVGVGGGALCDLAGFVAGVYRRGVRICLVPTTLVAAVDAAIGGKSGLNLDAKNQVGLFRHPDRVVIDTAVLAGLPEGLLRDGAAEALKAGYVGDPALVDLYERHGLKVPLAAVIERALLVKAGIVSRDFTETGERAHLNFGHTIGHALEVAGAMSHGAAVAVGMVAAARASVALAGFDGEARLRVVVARLGLPVEAPAVDPDRVWDLVLRDKKRHGGQVRMVLLEAVGRPRVAPVDDATVTAALAAVGIGGSTR